MISAKMRENANKFAYLVKAYPEKTVPEIIQLFSLPAVDLNCAIWAAVELKFITEMNMKSNHSKVRNLPETWDFGPDVKELQNSITYAFEKLNKDEKDMEENYLSNWTAGYFPQDILVGMKQLLEDKVLHEYELEDGENAYIFYTLYENAGKNWGTKQFKTNPLTGEENEQPEPKEPTLDDPEK